MRRPPPRSTRTDTLIPYTTLCRATGRDPPAPAHGRNATASAQHPGLQPGGFVGGAETAAFVAHQLHQRDLRVVGEEQMHVARQLVFEEGALLVDQQLGVAVVAPRDQIGRASWRERGCTDG